MLQLEKDIRSRLEVMMKQKSQRVKDLKTLYKQDRELCDIMCSVPFCIDMDSVPSLEQLDSYHSYLNDLTKEKVRLHHPSWYSYMSIWGRGLFFLVSLWLMALGQ